MILILFLSSVLIAAIIGGVTNHLAIKMLFYPRTELRLFGGRVPFTPGIIPKRRGEIAASFGQIVAQHLITGDAVKRWLHAPETDARLQSLLDELLERLLASDATPETLLKRLLSEEGWQSLSAKAPLWLGNKASTMIRSWWSEQGLGDRPLSAWLGSWSEERRQQLGGQVADYAIKELRKGLNSPRGEQLLRRMVEDLIGRMTGGGFLSSMLGSFLNVDSLVGKLREALEQKLDERSTQDLLNGWVSAKIDEYGRWSLTEVFQRLTGEDAVDWLDREFLAKWDWSSTFQSIMQLKLRQLLVNDKGEWIVKSNKLVKLAKDWLAQHLDAMLASVRLAKLVEEQIETFPIEQIERMILDVSGREFRAITWLGAVLGGLIGVVQFFLLNVLN